ncbi:MAG: ComEC/Rec2 family competence protein, partial [Patescibacteria group bacterium]
ALILAACLMLFFNPKLLSGDVGFQLSFGAVSGIIFGQSYLARKLKILPAKFHIRDLVATTLAAQIFILPLIVYYFGNLSFIAPIANLLVLPVLPYIMTAGFIFSFLLWLPSVLITVIIWPLKIVLNYVLFIIDFGSKLPLAALSVKNFGLIFMLCYYIILAIILFYVQFKRKIKLSPSN